MLKTTRSEETTLAVLVSRLSSAEFFHVEREAIANQASSCSLTARCSRGSTLLRTKPFNVPREMILTSLEYTAPAMGARAT